MSKHRVVLPGEAFNDEKENYTVLRKTRIISGGKKIEAVQFRKSNSYIETLTMDKAEFFETFKEGHLPPKKISRFNGVF